MVKAGSLFIPDDPHFRSYFESYEVFEGENLAKAIEACGSLRTAIDGGAHVGSWTKALAKKFNTVIAFEPDKDNFECLSKNTERLDNVILFQSALGPEISSSGFVSGTNSGSGYLHPGIGVNVLTVDMLNLDELDLLKLDIEGYEPLALLGALKTIERCHPVVLVEQKRSTARYGFEWDHAGKFLEDIGYKFFAQVNNDFIYRQ